MAIHKFTRAILNGEPLPIFGDGSTQRDYTYIDDIIDGVVRCVDTPFDFEVFNLGEHHTTSLSELIGLIEEATGREAKLDRQPLQPGDVTITFADIAHAREKLGYSPRFTMEEGIGRFVAWYRTQNQL